jgi:hypothetical protein
VSRKPYEPTGPRKEIAPENVLIERRDLELKRKTSREGMRRLRMERAARKLAETGGGEDGA